MFNSIQEFFQQRILEPLQEIEADNESALKLATATLLFEMSHADDEVDDREREAMQTLLRKRFELGEAEVEELVSLAEDTARGAVCMQEFTRLLNEHFSQSQKIQIIEMLWQVAYSDAVLDRYEEHYVRGIADLLYVPHKAYIAAKMRVKNDK